MQTEFWGSTASILPSPFLSPKAQRMEDEWALNTQLFCFLPDAEERKGGEHWKYSRLVSSFLTWRGRKIESSKNITTLSFLPRRGEKERRGELETRFFCFFFPTWREQENGERWKKKKICIASSLLSRGGKMRRADCSFPDTMRKTNGRRSRCYCLVSSFLRRRGRRQVMLFSSPMR